MNGSDNIDYINSSVNIMLEFVRAAILNCKITIPSNETIDWDALMSLSVEHGLLAWVWDGICKLPQGQQPNRQQRINWGLSAQEIWDNYYRHKKIVTKIVNRCNSSDIKVLLLKGLNLAELYPKPESRPSSDIDIYLFEHNLKGTIILSGGKYVLSDKHYVFEISGVQIECHIDLIDAGTKLQRRAHNYLLSSLSDSVITQAGYLVLPFWSTIIHTLMHIIAHFYNPGPDPLKIRSLVDYAMLLKVVKSKGYNQKYLQIIKSLELDDFSDLFIRMSEWILGDDFSTLCIHKDNNIEDIDKVKQIILNQDLRYPTFSNSSYMKQLFQRIRYYKRMRWKYKYLPEIKERRIWGSFLLQYHMFIKSIFGFPFDRPFYLSYRRRFNRNTSE